LLIVKYAPLNDVPSIIPPVDVFHHLIIPVPVADKFAFPLGQTGDGRIITGEGGVPILTVMLTGILVVPATLYWLSYDSAYTVVLPEG
jgi:hypothetical protein